MLSKVQSVVFHSVCSVSFTFGCFYDWVYVRIPLRASQMGFQFCGKLKFLTYWDAVLQSAYFLLCVTCDCITFTTNYKQDDKSRTNKMGLLRLRDRLFTSLAFPLSMFVGLTFWGLYAIDRELVFPRALDPYFPQWLNHVMHTNIMVCSLIEMCTSYRPYPTRKQGLLTLTGFMATYLVWMHIIYFKTNMWVYPVLDVLNWPMRVLFYLGLLGSSCGLYLAGEQINQYVWYKSINSKSV